MDRQRACLSLVPFASDDDCESLRRQLDGLGYPSEVIRPESWRDRGDVCKRSLGIVYLAASERLTSQAIATLEAMEATFSLGIVRGEVQPWHDVVLARCSDFLSLPCHERELELRLGRAFRGAALCRDAAGEADEEFVRMNLIGRSPAFLDALALIKRLSRCDVPVLIQGETGTGKEMAARAMHYLGARRGSPFVPVNCGAIPDSLFENELFGHERGAYTDAKLGQIGLVAEASGGTLFLDEIETLSQKGQVVLLRFLQDQKYKPLGGRRLRDANVRIIAASNVDLHALTELGDFRLDLLFRLNVVRVRLPPLRDRPGDIELLAGNFLAEFGARYGLPMKPVHPLVLDWLKRYRWPGNVRELQNFAHRLFVLGDAAVLDELACEGEVEAGGPGGESAPDPSRLHLSFRKAKAKAIAEFESSYLHYLLGETQGNVTMAAKRAGKERRALGRLLKKHGIRREQYLAPGKSASI